MIDAFFAGRIFVLGEQNDYHFLLWGDHVMPSNGDEGIFLSTTVAEPAQGAFLCQLERGWLLVAGAGEYKGFRHTFFDASPEASDNAAALHALGIPIITVEEGNSRVRSDGVPLFSVTGDERRCADAAARHSANLQ